MALSAPTGKVPPLPPSAPSHLPALPPGPRASALPQCPRLSSVSRPLSLWPEHAAEAAFRRGRAAALDERGRGRGVAWCGAGGRGLSGRGVGGRGVGGRGRAAAWAHPRRNC